MSRRTAKLLVIDDEAQSLEVIGSMLETLDIEILATTDAQEGLAIFNRERPQVVLVDLKMPKLGGMEVLDRVLAIEPATDVVLMTGYYASESAVEAIQKGAADYLNKPIDVDQLRRRVRQLIDDAERRGDTLELDQELVERFQFEGLIGRSPLMLDMFTIIRRIAPHFRAVLIGGATGTGKELAARALHRLSPYAANVFAVCNCAAMVETLFESELFGHVRGAFTGAFKDHEGLFEHADHGSVLLDEIGELPLAAQAKLLRVLQNQEVQRVGSTQIRKIDVRVIAATNRDLRGMVAKGQFREDLYYRLSMAQIRMPSLLERREDLPLLERHFVRLFSLRYNKPLRGITRRAQAVLRKYSWPGNVRELENVIGNAAMMTDSPLIDLRDLPANVRAAEIAPAAASTLRSLQEVERLHALYVLEQVGGDKTRAAHVLGISRNTLYSLIAKQKAAVLAAL
jgi:DNA-binding NtrC family response regulator